MKKLHLLSLVFVLFCIQLVSAQQPQVTVLQNNHHNNDGAAKPTSAIGSRLIAFNQLKNDGASYVNYDSAFLVYSGTRGGDLAHVLKYDNANEWRWNIVTSAWDNKYKYTQTFDANNNLTDQLEMIWNTVTNAWQNYSHSINTFDALNNLLTGVQQSWNTTTNTWDNTDKYTYTYDANGNALTEVQQVWNGSTNTWDNQYKYTNTFNAANKKTLSIEQSWNGSTWDNWYKYTYTYDANNNQLTYLSQLWNTSTSSWDNSYLTTDTYNPANQHLMSIQQSWNTSTSSWDNYSKDIYADFVGINAQTDTTQHWNGSTSVWQNYSRYRFTFNSYGQPLTEIEDSWNIGGFWQAASGDYEDRLYYETYTTDVKSLTARGGDAEIYPVPANDKLNIDLNWNEPQPFTVSIIDLQGRVTRAWQVAATANYHGTVSVNDLPFGTYFIKIEGTKGQIVKQLIVAPR